MNDKRYNVLWFEDNPKVSFINLAYLSGIDITVGKNKDEGLEILRMNPTKFDALILDANYKRANETESLILAELINEITEICGNKKPWFVLTAGDYQGIEAISYIIPESLWENKFGTKRFYNKVGAEEQKLFDDIKRVVDEMNTSEWRLRNEYKEIYSLFQSTIDVPSVFNINAEPELTRILLAFNNTMDYSNADYFNAIRRFVAGEVIVVLKDIGVVPHSISQLNAIMYHVGNKKFRDYIPVYVQQAVFSIIEICQDGSHSGNELVEGKIPPIVEKSVKTGNAPYLLRSIILDLLTVLWWLKDFVKERDKEINEIIFSSDESIKPKPSSKDVLEDIWIPGNITKIDEKGWGIMKCDYGTLRIPPSMMRITNIIIDDVVEFTTKPENNKHINKIIKAQL